VAVQEDHLEAGLDVRCGGGLVDIASRHEGMVDVEHVANSVKEIRIVHARDSHHSLFFPESKILKKIDKNQIVK
jgi:hypothetical protein